LETETGFGTSLLHGEAVAIGMVLAFKFSAARGLCSPDDVERVRRHFEKIGLPTSLRTVAHGKWNPRSVIDHMHQDKKVSDGHLTFVLTRGIGSAFIERGVDAGEVARLLEGELAN
jgi:3-dehydroquinate synthase